MSWCFLRSKEKEKIQRFLLHALYILSFFSTRRAALLGSKSHQNDEMQFLCMLLATQWKENDEKHLLMKLEAFWDNEFEILIIKSITLKLMTLFSKQFFVPISKKDFVAYFICVKNFWAC